VSPPLIGGEEEEGGGGGGKREMKGGGEKRDVSKEGVKEKDARLAEGESKVATFLLLIFVKKSPLVAVTFRSQELPTPSIA
jgi:hypothetical protein